MCEPSGPQKLFRPSPRIAASALLQHFLCGPVSACLNPTSSGTLQKAWGVGEGVQQETLPGACANGAVVVERTWALLVVQQGSTRLPPRPRHLLVGRVTCFSLAA